jgi:hypothetical protein
MAMGGTVPERAMQELMKVSIKMMQNQPGFKLTQEQAEKYADVSMQAMSGVTSMRMLVGVAEPGAGLYGNTSAVMTVKDSKAFLDQYEKSLAATRQLAEDAKSPAIPVATSERVKVGETEALEVSMSFPSMKDLAPAGGADPQKIMQLFAGPDGKLKTYIAPADEHAVVMAYTSPERLKEALEFYKSKQPGLSADTGIAKVAAKLPPGSQFVGYASLSGLAEMVKQVMGTVPGAPPAMIPDFPESPPFGFAAKVSATGIQGHFVVTAETLRTLGGVVAKVRAEARERRQQQEQQQ